MTWSQARPGLLATFLLVLGFGAGYAFRILTERLADQAPSPPAESGGLEFPSRADHAGSRDPLPGRGSHLPGAKEAKSSAFARAAGEREGAHDFEGPPDDNPFRGLPRDEVMAALSQAVETRDFYRLKMAAQALGPLEPSGVERIGQMLLACEDPEVAGQLAHVLARFGSEAGLQAVADLTKSEKADLEVRRRALDALAEVPEERRPKARAVLTELLASGLPRKLEFPAAHALGRVLGENAASGLIDLLGTQGIPQAPVLQALRDFCRVEDLPRLTDLLGKVTGRDEQEVLLRAIGSAAGPRGGELLLGFLRDPPPGVRREAAGGALEEFVRKEDLPALWETLSGEKDRTTQAALARAVARLGGSEAIARLAEMTRDPAAGLSIEAFARALEGTAKPETVPILVDALRQARGWESAGPLADEIMRVSGKQSVDALLALVRDGGSEERKRAIIQAVENFGDSSAVEGLASLLETQTEHGVVFHLAKAILHLDPTQGPQDLARRFGEFSSGDQRAAIASVLEKEGSAELVPALAEALSGEAYGRAQWHLARAIASFGEEGISAIRDFIERDAEPRRRGEALRGLESVRPDVALSLARELLQDPAPDVRRVAVKMLGAPGSSGEAIRELRSLLSREADPGVLEVLQAILGNAPAK